MNFKKKNMDTWERKELFQHFINNLRCVMSMTVEIDVTDFLKKINSKGYKFYPAMIWVITSAINSREEFRMGYDKEGNVGVWDYVSPYYTHFYKDDKSFVKLVTEYTSNCELFQEKFAYDLIKYENFRGFDQQEIPKNTFDLSCLPWVHYKSFDMHIFDSGTYLAPVITWGKYQKNENERVIMPISMNIHHAVADGYHLCQFFLDIEYWMKQI